MAVFFRVFNCFLLFTVCSNLGAQTKESVLALDPDHRDKYAENPEEVAKYWISIAMYNPDGSFTIQFPPPPMPAINENSTVEERLQFETAHIKNLMGLASSVGPGPERESLKKEIDAAMRDEELAERVFQIIGPENCQQKAIEQLAAKIEFVLNQRLGTSPGLTPILGYEPFAETMNLSKDQHAAVNLEIENSDSEFKGVGGRLMRDLAKASAKRWTMLLRVLDSDQREFAETRIGKPVEWFRAISKQALRRQLAYVSGLEHEEFGTKARKLAEAGVTLNELPLKKLEEMELDVFDSLVFGIFNEETIWDELELVAEQRDRIISMQKGRYPESSYLYSEPKKRFEALLDLNADIPTIVRDVLLPDQLEWFQQIEFQIRTEPKYDSTVGLLDPRVVKHLKLTDKQQKEMKLIGDEFAEVLRTSTEKINAEKKRIEDELESKLADLLDEEQLVLYRKFTKAVPSKGDTSKEAGVSR